MERKLVLSGIRKDHWLADRYKMRFSPSSWELFAIFVVFTALLGLIVILPVLPVAFFVTSDAGHNARTVVCIIVGFLLFAYLIMIIVDWGNLKELKKNIRELSWQLGIAQESIATLPKEKAVVAAVQKLNNLAAALVECQNRSIGDPLNTEAKAKRSEFVRAYKCFSDCGLVSGGYGPFFPKKAA